MLQKRTMKLKPVTKKATLLYPAAAVVVALAGCQQQQQQQMLGGVPLPPPEMPCGIPHEAAPAGKPVSAPQLIPGKQRAH